MKKKISIIYICTLVIMNTIMQEKVTARNRNVDGSMETVDSEGLKMDTDNINWEDSVKMYIREARWENRVTAYEELADCYHDGRGVEHNFMNMLFMYLQASEKRGVFLENYIHQYEADDPDRLLFDAMNDIEQKKFDDATARLEKLKAMNQPSSITLQALLAAEMDKDQEKSERLLLEASEKGCSLGQLLYAKSAEERKNDTEYKKRLESITANIPMTYNHLGTVYWEEGREIDSEKLMNRAKDCFRKADEYACLMKQNARRLLYCYKKDVEAGKVICDSVELEHVQVIACVDPFSKEEIVSYEYEE